MWTGYLLKCAGIDTGRALSRGGHRLRVMRLPVPCAPKFYQREVKFSCRNTDFTDRMGIDKYNI